MSMETDDTDQEWRPISEQPDLPISGKGLISVAYGGRGTVVIGAWDGQKWKSKFYEAKVLGWQYLPEAIPVSYSEVPKAGG